MYSNNVGPESRNNGTGTAVQEVPPESTSVPEPVHREEARMAAGSVPPQGTPTRPIDPITQPQWSQQTYSPQPIPHQAATPPVRQGASPVVVVLSILGALLLLGFIFMVAMIFMLSKSVGNLANPAVGELRTETKSVPLGEAKSAVVNINMGVGKLAVTGGATDLMDATFNYNVESLKPTVSYSVKGTEGTLLVQQPTQGSISTGGNTRYEWNLIFKKDVPMTMKVALGVGEGNLKFSGLTVNKLEVSSGVGDTTIDLTGINAPQNVSVVVKGGVGKINLVLPQNIGVQVTADGGLGKVNASGLTVNGNTYTNSAYGTTGSTISIDVKTGIGDLSLVQGR